MWLCFNSTYFFTVTGAFSLCDYCDSIHLYCVHGAWSVCGSVMTVYALLCTWSFIGV